MPQCIATLSGVSSKRTICKFWEQAARPFVSEGDAGIGPALLCNFADAAVTVYDPSKFSCSEGFLLLGKRCSHVM